MKSEHKWLGYYRTMLVIRYFEEKTEDLFSRGLVKGTAHPCIGQEAIATGAAVALKKGDYVTSTHRGHGHFIAQGADPRRIMAELFGKVTGYSAGRGGSQLMADYRLGFVGSNGITGGGIPVATGVGLSIKLTGSGRVAVCFFGDGAANQGTFHESLNMAGLWQLPVVYVCENNMYAMSTPVSKSVPIPDIADRASSYGFSGLVVDGNDLLAVKEAVGEACARARRKDGPTLVECKTYRLSGHSRGDPRVYRSAGEEDVWRRRDPIKRFRRLLMDRDLLTREDDAAIKKQARKIIRESTTFARKSSYPEPASLEEGVFA